MMNTYAQPYYAGSTALLEAIERDDVAVLGEAIVGAALYEEDFEVVHDACVRLSAHADETVRGNAVLGFGHLARLFGRASAEAVEIVRRALGDASPYVRGQGWAAASDLRHFLGTDIDPDEGAPIAEPQQYE